MQVYERVHSLKYTHCHVSSGIPDASSWLSEDLSRFDKKITSLTETTKMTMKKEERQTMEIQLNNSKRCCYQTGLCGTFEHR